MKFVEKYSLSNLNALKVNEKAKFYCELTKENELVDILEFSKINNLPIIVRRVLQLCIWAAIFTPILSKCEKPILNISFTLFLMKPSNPGL